MRSARVKARYLPKDGQSPVKKIQSPRVSISLLLISNPVTSSAKKGEITYIQHNQSFADDAVIIHSSSASSLAKWISKNRMTYTNKISNPPTAFPPFKNLCDTDMTESLDDC